MLIAEYLVSVRKDGMQGPGVSSSSTEILVIALIVILLGFLIWIFIRASSKRSIKN